uniref:Uncharacterized protein n=1 Tax=Physcomitrium patens TaxID=3218 RepID=A0A2K1L713_PHYPA|nr:hypothetical protein PHYPA_000237 [Physcomitrium patens]
MGGCETLTPSENHQGAQIGGAAVEQATNQPHIPPPPSAIPPQQHSLSLSHSILGHCASLIRDGKWCGVAIPAASDFTASSAFCGAFEEEN